MKEVDWFNCYGEGWAGLIDPDAFAHPAKFSRGLIRRIYAHAFERGWFKAGDAIVDPFAGVALGALHAMQLGLHWTGVELESRFVDLGQANIALWNARFAAHLPKWGTARLVQGDSRELARVLGEAGGSVSSPPYATGCQHQGGDTSDEPIEGGTFHGVGITGSVSSPPYAHIRPEKSGPGVDLVKQYETYRAQGGGASFEKFTATQRLRFQGYGLSPGQLGALPEGELAGAVSSPPYTASLASDDPEKRGGLYRDPKRREDRTLTAEYGVSPGQLGAMREGELAGAVSSPPYADSVKVGHSPDGDIKRALKSGHTLQSMGNPGGQLRYKFEYGTTPANLGNEQGDTFWTAARTIMEQLYQTLAPGAHAIWVVKAFVRGGQRVDFPGQWRDLGEACGFESVEWIRAWVVEDHGAQLTLTGEIDRRRIERKSFFRVLAEKKARAARFWESVDRDDKARHLWAVHTEVWPEYEQRLQDPTDESPPRPTRNRITVKAQMRAYKEAGQPHVEIDTSIDYEVVLVQRKPGAAEVGRELGG